MEEYVNKRNYLNHLKQISAIKNGQYISGITQSKSRIKLLNNNTLRQNNFFTNISPKSQLSITRRSNQPFSTRNKSTEQIMRSFLIQKQNLRLVERIGSMNSEIKMKKYQQEYKQNKKLMKIHAKIKKPPEYFIFKVFDIKFQSHIVEPDQVFTLFEVVKHKKKLITQGTIFQLRKQEIKTTKNQIHFLKIQGRQSGIVQLSMTCFLPIMKNKQEIGNLIIDIV